MNSSSADINAKVAELDNRLHRRRYRDLLKHAAFLHREFEGPLRSTRFLEKTEGANQAPQIIHVFDTSLVTSGLAPWEYGPLGGDGSHGYGQMLPRRYSFADLSDLDPLQSSIIKRNYELEDRLAAAVITQLSNIALNRPDWKIKDGEKTVRYQLPSHRLETDGQFREFENSAMSSQIDTDFYQNKVKQDISDLARTFKKQSEENKSSLTVHDILERFLTRILERKTLREFGSAFKNIELTKFRNEYSLKELDLFSLHDLNSSVTGKGGEIENLDQDELVAHNVLRTYFFGKLSNGRQRPGAQFARNDVQDPHAGTQSWSSQKRDSNYWVDAEALADLAIMNRRLNVAGVPVRVVLVTCHRRLVEVTYGAYDEFREQLGTFLAETFGPLSYSELVKKEKILRDFFQLDDEGTSRWFCGFALLYVRHVHAYAHEKFTESESTQDINGVFSGLFASESDSTESRPRRLEHLVLDPAQVPVPDDFRTKFVATLRDWQSLVRRATNQVSFERSTLYQGNTAREFVDLVEKDLQKLVLDFDGLDPDRKVELLGRWIAEFVDRVRDRTMLHLSNVGTETLIDKREGLVVKHPPDLRFKTLNHTQELFDDLAMSGGYDRLRHSGAAVVSRKFLEQYQNIIRDTGLAESEESEPGASSGNGSATDDQTHLQIDDRQLSHLRFLALGAAFASAGKWQTAQVHAKRAIAIITRSDDLGHPVPTKDAHTNMSGREARYLDAVCYRMRAESPTELLLATESLRSSEQAFFRDRTTHGNEGRADQHIFDLRYVNEKLSIILAEYYMVRSTCGHDPDVPPGECTGVGCEECSAAASKVFDHLLSDDFTKYFDAAFSAEHADDAPALTHLFATTNVVQVATIHRYWTRTAQADLWPDVTKWLIRLENASKYLNGVIESQVFVKTAETDIYAIVGRTLVNPDDCETEALTAALGRWATASSMVYDQWRFRKIRELVDTILATRGEAATIKEKTAVQNE